MTLEAGHNLSHYRLIEKIGEGANDWRGSNVRPSSWHLQLHNVISDITGVTGMRILRDIVAGVTDPMALAAHRDYRCRASQDEIAADQFFVDSLPFPVYEEYEECSTVRGVRRSRNAPREAPPPQIRTSGITASGSYLG